MKYDKLIERWLTAPPSYESKDTVEKVLVHYFGEDCLKSKAASSHQYKVKDSRLAGLPPFAPYGYLSVPVCGGQRVVKVYLRQIAQAVRHIESLEDSSNE